MSTVTLRVSDFYEPPHPRDGSRPTFLYERPGFFSVVLHTPRLGWVDCYGCHRGNRDHDPYMTGIGLWGLCDDCRARIARIVQNYRAFGRDIA